MTARHIKEEKTLNEYTNLEVLVLDACHVQTGVAEDSRGRDVHVVCPCYGIEEIVKRDGESIDEIEMKCR